jgi:hypothetical protein
LTALDDELRELLARRELYDLALRYARACDRRDGAAFETLFTEDASLSGHHGDPDTEPAIFAVQGRASIIKGMRVLERYRSTFHLVANQLVEFAADGESASGETYCTAHHIRDVDGTEMNLTMAIRYQDEFQRTAEGWRFSRRRLAVDWERDLPLSLAPADS